MTQPHTTKPQLRARLREHLSAIPPGERASRSGAVCRRALDHGALNGCRAMLAYLPPATNADAAEPAELDPTALIEAARDVGMLIAAPHIDWADRTMSPRLLTPDDPPIVRRHAVPEPPESAPPLPLDQIDLILLPGVAFDRQRNRLGRGAGFYDRILAAARGLPRPPRTLGLCFDLQLVARVPTDPHDRPADALVAETVTIDPAPRPGG